MAGVKGRSGSGGKRAGAGRKKKSEEERVARLIDSVVDDDDWRRIVRAVMARAQAGDVPAAKELMDRRFGRVVDKKELTGEASGPISIVVREIAMSHERD